MIFPNEAMYGVDILFSFSKVVFLDICKVAEV